MYEAKRLSRATLLPIGGHESAIRECRRPNPERPLLTRSTTTAATMLTLPKTLGTTSASGSYTLKLLLKAQLLVIEVALILSVVSLLRRGEEVKRRLVLASAVLVVLGTLLLWVSATLIVLLP